MCRVSGRCASNDDVSSVVVDHLVLLVLALACLPDLLAEHRAHVALEELPYPLLVVCAELELVAPLVILLALQDVHVSPVGYLQRTSLGAT